MFTNTKIGASRLARELIREGIAADAIHGDKTQNERLVTLEKFKQGQVEVLVATDVAARGLDIAELPAVINYDIPYSPEDYVHRIGRTGRAGASGQAISLMTSLDERLVADVEALVGKKLGRESLVITLAEPPRRLERAAVGRQPEQPSDPLFFQPYQEPGPGHPPQTVSTSGPARGAAPKMSTSGLFSGLRKPGAVAVLLGGKPKP